MALLRERCRPPEGSGLTPIKRLWTWASALSQEQRRRRGRSLDRTVSRMPLLAHCPCVSNPSMSATRGTSTVAEAVGTWSW